MPAEGWRKYLMAVRQQAIFLARSGRLEITRKGEVIDPDNFKSVIRLRRKGAGSPSRSGRLPAGWRPGYRNSPGPLIVRRAGARSDSRQEPKDEA